MSCTYSILECACCMCEVAQALVRGGRPEVLLAWPFSNEESSYILTKYTKIRLKLSHYCICTLQFFDTSRSTPYTKYRLDHR